MSEINRFRVKSEGQSWADAGPDLLRPREKARRTLATMLTDKPPRLYVKIGDGEWRKLGSKAAVMDRFDEWRSDNPFQVGIRRRLRVRPLAAIRRESVRILPLDNCSPATALAWSLVRHAFPGIAFGGGYVYKETSPGYWSDHAWGTACDASGYALNERVTAWVARMAATGSMNFDYALGSLNGYVISIDADGSISRSGASSSHKWHVHLSIVDHDGRKPPRTGGVW